MIVCMKWAKCLMVRDLESKALCDSLNGEFAELLKFFFFHRNFVFRVPQKSQKSQKFYLLCKYLVYVATRGIFPKENISAISAISAGLKNYPLRYSSVFVYSPVWFEYVTNLRNSHLRS